MRGEQRRPIVRRAAVGLGLAAFGVFAVLPSAAAKAPAPKVEAAATVAKVIDLSTVPKIETYLRSIGVDPRGVVIQRGLRNYAGPKCPGTMWNCTTSSKVVQISLRGADGGNRFVCRRESGTGSATSAPPCVIVQSGPGGNNSARCDIETHQADGEITQTCHVTQTGSRNRAFARLVAVMGSDDTNQDVFQTISVRQTSSGSGGNTLEASSLARLSTNGSGSDPVTQDVHQITCGNQSASGNGANVARVAQSQTLSAEKNGASSVDIAQNVDLVEAVCTGPATDFPTTFHPDPVDCAVDAVSHAKEFANACTRVHQTAVNGRNTISLNQPHVLTAEAKGTTGNVSIVQGNPSASIFDPQTGTDATLDQESAGLSQIFGGGVTRQIVDVVNTGGLEFIDQTDFGPRCCAGGHQATNPGNDFLIGQTLTQRAKIDGVLVDPGYFTGGAIDQFGAALGDCETSGLSSTGGGCIVKQSASNNVASATNQCGPASSCHIFVACEAFTPEGSFGLGILSVGACTPGTTSPPD